MSLILFIINMFIKDMAINSGFLSLYMFSLK